MSTSNPIETAFLEQLANQYFQAQPGQQPVSSSHNDILLQHGETVNMAEPQTSLHDPHFPGGRGPIPASVAGSGKSPSAQQLGEDPKIGGLGSQVNTSTLTSTGGGRTPSSLPLEHENTFEEQLQAALKGITQYVPTGQLPFTDSSYYFIPSDGQSITAAAPFDVNRVKADFPILNQYVNGRPLIWLDNAATTQKPRHVIERLSYFYEHENSNIHRGAHTLAARATDAYEEARKKVQLFLNAGSPNEIVFVRGTTEAINLVANSWGDQNIKAGDEIVVTHLEHHANIVPWQQLAARKGAILKVAPVDEDGQIILEEYARLLGPKTKLVSFTQVSNALGTVTPAKQMTDLAHQAGAKVLIDGAQSVSHMKADVRYLDADWFAFSGHKVFGPTGIGVLYGKEALLNETQPWQGGGNMISDVTFEHTKYQPAPARFEAGTGNIADAVGLGAAIDYVNSIGIEVIHQYEHYLLQYATRLLKDIPGLRLIGTAPDKAGVLSFVLQGFRTEEVGTALSNNGIAVRSGHHCAQPILRRFGLESSVRPSLAFYNTCTDIDALVNTVRKLRSASPL
ncbi:family 2A encapsulin nanocompartment cargo protein cysteine desulfurase [Chitinophaga sp. LS1]|uniref:family 2A encapsulin nanocompartment cargo protein cysteine desulfurase n=1 Tax=Chitinophaga sp. LS1 TaxID=3051176 RepID=UPI002AAAF115|nr:family 2A encapsulin nanocompartment cargo protein cysteine desulfurase [Chitinophaga sp. LS1]WPV65285.1 family 2A encapsulin nanocompartment cargo protein cysteine desulfurase [Chitinophaga sp. LS1]